MSFSDLRADAAVVQIEQLGDPCVFVTKEGAEIPTFAELIKSTSVIGQFSEVTDSRPSIGLIKAVVGKPVSGTVRFASETYALDKPISPSGDMNADDGFVVRYYVRQVTHG